VALWAVTLAAGYWTFVVLMPGLWRWAGDSVFREAVAVFASILLLYVPGVPGYMAYDTTSAMADSKTARAAEKAEAEVQKTEREAIDRLESGDLSGLLPLLRYSRAQLEQYYKMGLAQTKRSFFHALVAMWLGFILLVMGLALYVGPVEKLGLHRPSLDFNLLILATATIIEFISALFLWIYRSTMGQLTYYYRLQMRSHTAILCFRMSTSMTDGKDAAIGTILNALLDMSLEPERPAPEHSRGMRNWLSSAIPPVPRVTANKE
jgi:hypothetical protein